MRKSSQLSLIDWLSAPIDRNPLARDPLGQRSRSGFDPLCGGLRTASHLRTLLLRDVGIDDGEAEGVASFLALSVRLEKLDLSENQVIYGLGKQWQVFCFVVDRSWWLLLVDLSPETTLGSLSTPWANSRIKGRQYCCQVIHGAPSDRQTGDERTPSFRLKSSSKCRIRTRN